jgi:pimeloyl-ACP methyl ester carboxylesterase
MRKEATVSLTQAPRLTRLRLVILAAVLAVIGTADHAIPPAGLLFMAHRAHAHITEINAGHLSLITNPGAVARVIIDAANATTG